jgi:hypothetical protein
MDPVWSRSTLKSHHAILSLVCDAKRLCDVDVHILIEQTPSCYSTRPSASIETQQAVSAFSLPRHAVTASHYATRLAKRAREPSRRPCRGFVASWQTALQAMYGCRCLLQSCNKGSFLAFV